jgi:ABC-2 type transport system ATP-binding protein
VITVQGLTKTYGKQQAVKNISFTINNGEVVGFLGPNGAGKTTTMNIVTGYLSATSGSVQIDGIDIADDPEGAKRKIGYLPEQPPLYLEMSVKEYLSFAAELKKVPRKQRKAAIDEVMELTAITDVRKRIIRNLSKGYRQRVGLAQALVAKPEVLILDEPTVGLDPIQIQDIRSLIRRLGENRTIILSSHILPEVSAVCSRVLIIDRGTIVADGNAAKLAQGVAGQNKLLLRTAGDASALKSVLGSSALQSAGISSFAELPSGEMSIDFADAKDPRTELFYALAEAKLPILTLRFADLSLEDVFLRLTNRDEEVQK